MPKYTAHMKTPILSQSHDFRRSELYNRILGWELFNLLMNNDGDTENRFAIAPVVRSGVEEHATPELRKYSV